MKTPFCVAIGIRQRELGELRRRIAAEHACLAHAAHQIAVIDTSASAERLVVASGWTIAADHYFKRLSEERVRTISQRSRATAGLAELRDGAAAALGSLRAIEEASATWRSEARARIEAADQSASDDRSAGVHASLAAADRKRSA